MSDAAASREFRIEETGERINGLELELHLFFGLWRVVERTGETRLVVTENGKRRTLVPVST